MLLHGTIESVYKGTLVYACEHNPTVSDVYVHKGNPSVWLDSKFVNLVENRMVHAVEGGLSVVCSEVIGASTLSTEIELGDYVATRAIFGCHTIINARDGDHLSGIVRE